ncbi:MurR/RpiR family transcriptional regulator [Naumannella sp. ID2617S]|uniref:RpiR family transcriptional regulator n=1 Tax=Enemella dayhoffiae TaxID=2016507 RepID=A0A255GWR4_9ACTN|nr:MurR/RpiR family transcriptional regulator [Enemella dayhoffiae]NNG19005.1 MurR/RpiR family transcriptional regulator [Naumannella sp. ID2617S]OYO19263.1 RpiR family transcriptional regulator [Enemella dayhoffiae]
MEGRGPAQASVLVRLRALRPTLAPAEARVAELVLADPRAVAGLTITELAELASTSETSVLRFARRLGLKGYPGLRLALAEAGAENGRNSHPVGDITRDDPIDVIVAKVTGAGARAVEETGQQLDREVLATVARLVAAAGRVDLYGAHASGLVAGDLQQKLHRIGLVAYFWSDPHQALASATLLAEGDVAIAVSHTGTTTEAVEVLETAQARGVATVAITNYPESPLGRTADFVLTTAADETALRSGAMASRIAALMVVDCLFLAAAQHRYDRAIEAVARTREVVRGHHRSAR